MNLKYCTLEKSIFQSRYDIFRGMEWGIFSSPFGSEGLAASVFS